MTWTKLGDEWGDESAELSDGAARTHVEALCWSNRHLKDMFVPKPMLRRFAGTDDPERAAAELVRAGWWQDHGDEWFVGCRFPEWQLDAAQVLHRREQQALRQRRRRLHRIGEHQLCVPDNCSDAAAPRDASRRESQGESRRDIPRDVTRDQRGDPGRVGSGRDGALEEEQNQNANKRTDEPEPPVDIDPWPGDPEPEPVPSYWPNNLARGYDH